MKMKEGVIISYPDTGSDEGEPTPACRHLAEMSCRSAEDNRETCQGSRLVICVDWDFDLRRDEGYRGQEVQIIPVT